MVEVDISYVKNNNTNTKGVRGDRKKVKVKDNYLCSGVF